MEAPEELVPVEFDTRVGILLVSAVTDLISSFATVFPVAVATSPDAEPLRSLLSTRTFKLLLILLLCREFVLCGGAGGCLVFITERLRVQFRLFFASSPAAADPDAPDSTSSPVTIFSFLLLGQLIMLTELRRLTRSWSPPDCSAWLSCPLRPTLCEL